MRKNNTWKLLAVAFCILLVLLSALSATLSVSHASHRCYVEQCTVCAIIQSALRVLRGVALLALCLGLLAGIAASFFPAPRAAAVNRAATPITLKTRMNP